MATPRGDLAPLASVTVVLRGRRREGDTNDGSSDDRAAAVCELPHVVTLVSAFLDGAISTRWSLEQACERGFGLRMLRRLAAHEAMAAEASCEVDGAKSPIDPYYRAYLARKALVAGIKQADDVDVVRWICCEYCPRVVPVKAIVTAVKRARMRVLQWLFEKYPSVQPNAYLLECAVEAGRLDVLQLIVPRLEVSEETAGWMLCEAAQYGELDIVQWLHARHCQLGKPTSLVDTTTGRAALGKAIEGGHFETIKFLARQGYRLDRPFQGAYHAAISSRGVNGIGEHEGRDRSGVKRDDLKMIKWLHEHRFTEYTAGWIDVAASIGDLRIVKWCHDNIRTGACSTNAMDDAASGGHLEIVKWLHANRTEGCTPRAMDLAAEGGRLEVLKWLHANRTEGCTSTAMDLAAGHGHLDVVQWLHSNRTEGCTSVATILASNSGHLDVVKWLHENRSVEWSIAEMDSAAAAGHLKIVKWLHEHRTEGCSTEAMDKAAMNGHLHVVQWLHENRREGGTANAMDLAQSIETLGWLYTNRAVGCTTWATERAAQRGQFTKLLWLNEKRFLAFSQEAVDNAARKCHFEIYQWLRERFEAHVGEEVVDEPDDTKTSFLWTMFTEFETASH